MRKNPFDPLNQCWLLFSRRVFFSLYHLCIFKIIIDDIHSIAIADKWNSKTSKSITLSLLLQSIVRCHNIYIEVESNIYAMASSHVEILLQNYHWMHKIMLKTANDAQIDSIKKWGKKQFQWKLMWTNESLIREKKFTDQTSIYSLFQI